MPPLLANGISAGWVWAGGGAGAWAAALSAVSRRVQRANAAFTMRALRGSLILSGVNDATVRPGREPGHIVAAGPGAVLPDRQSNRGAAGRPLVRACPRPRP